jgi:ParB/RepB/Spo0J family partition protein
MELLYLPVKDFAPNPWNSNRMSQEEFEHLKRTIKARGFQGAIVSRPDGKKQQIIDGEHRWRAACELGLEKIPCNSQQMDDETAKTLTLLLNSIKGADDPSLKAKLLQDIVQNHHVQVEQLAVNLNMKLEEVKAYIDLSNLPDFDMMDMRPAQRFIDCPHCNKQIDMDTVKTYTRKKDKKNTATINPTPQTPPISGT